MELQIAVYLSRNHLFAVESDTQIDLAYFFLFSLNLKPVTTGHLLQLICSIGIKQITAECRYGLFYLFRTYTVTFIKIKTLNQELLVRFVNIMKIKDCEFNLSSQP